MDYWKCDENCITNKDDTCKFVIAEELNHGGKHFNDKFLKSNVILTY